MKAFKVTGGRHEHAVIVLAEKRSRAIADAIGELDCEYRDARAVRAPQFDDGLPSWRTLVEDHGWYKECANCGRASDRDDLNEGGFFVDDDDLWCRRCGPEREAILQDRRDRIAAQEALKVEYTERAKEKWPFAEVLHAHVTLRRTDEVWYSSRFRGAPQPLKIRRHLRVVREESQWHEHQVHYFYSPRIALQVTGCRWPVEWEPLIDPKHVLVAPEDVETWTQLAPPRTVAS